MSCHVMSCHVMSCLLQLKISLINVQLAKKKLFINSIVSLIGFINIFFKVLSLFDIKRKSQFIRMTYYWKGLRCQRDNKFLNSVKLSSYAVIQHISKLAAEEVLRRRNQFLYTNFKLLFCFLCTFFNYKNTFNA